MTNLNRDTSVKILRDFRLKKFLEKWIQEKRRWKSVRGTFHPLPTEPKPVQPSSASQVRGNFTTFATDLQIAGRSQQFLTNLKLLMIEVILDIYCFWV
jgi:hypothetical protein